MTIDCLTWAHGRRGRCSSHLLRRRVNLRGIPWMVVDQFLANGSGGVNTFQCKNQVVNLNHRTVRFLQVNFGWNSQVFSNSGNRVELFLWSIRWLLHYITCCFYLLLVNAKMQICKYRKMRCFELMLSSHPVDGWCQRLDMKGDLKGRSGCPKKGILRCFQNEK